MDSTLADTLEAVLLAEVVPALGCTEPIAIALAAAKARALLGAAPERLRLVCSGNVIKNARAVVVPHAGGRRGLEVAGALGALAGDPDAGLECVEGVTPAQADEAAAWVEAGQVEVALAEGVAGLYIRAEIAGGGHEASVTLAGTHTHVAETRRDGDVLTSAPVVEAADTVGDALSLATILTFARTVDLSTRPRLVAVLDDQLAANEAIADEGLRRQWGAEIGRTLLATHPDDVRTRARALPAAGSDARMSGCPLPVMINSGSGNQGMTVSLPVLAYARELGSTREDLSRALVLANLVAIHQKRMVGRLSAFCGAVSAAAGAAAGIAFLKGLDDDALGKAVVNTVATSGGIVCDGAKPSCASKISVAVENATCGVDMAERGITFDPGDGLVGDDVEQTLRNVARVAREGMAGTDVEILTVMLEQGRR